MSPLVRVASAEIKNKGTATRLLFLFSAGEPDPSPALESSAFFHKPLPGAPSLSRSLRQGLP